MFKQGFGVEVIYLVCLLVYVLLPQTVCKVNDLLAVELVDHLVKLTYDVVARAYQIGLISALEVVSDLVVVNHDLRK